VTIGDLLDNVADSADDLSTSYRIKARRWLNLVRAHVANQARWRGAVRVDHFSTSVAHTDGLYVLEGYRNFAEDHLYDETSIQPIYHETHGLLNDIDIQKQTTGPPTWWGDAGSDNNGNHQIYLWPIPAATYVIRFTGQARLVDMTEDNENDTVDHSFGDVASWSSLFAEGLEYHKLKDANENPNQVLVQLRTFEKAIKDKRSIDRTSPVASTLMTNLRQRTRRRRSGRFDPAHFENR